MKRLLIALAFAAGMVSSAQGQAHSLALPVAALQEPMRATRGDVPPDWLAQRAIEREWGASDDSLYTEVSVAGWKSEPTALLASALLPGAGQLYAEEGSGWIFLAGEVAGWTLRALSVRRADDRTEEFATLAGDPYVPASGWSFDRYEAATGGDPTWLQTLWVADREAFYLALAREPAYRAGFAGDAQATFDRYRGLREEREDALSRARTLEVLLVMNHLVAAWDALRAARFHNLPLRRALPVQLGTEWREGEPRWTASLVRRF